MKKRTKIAIGVIAGVFLVVAIISDPGKERVNTFAHEQNTKPEATNGIGTGQILKTEYFDVVVHEYSIKDKINTGNQFSDLKREDGTKYLIIDVSFRNTDRETRMMTDGEILLTQADGNVYKYEHSEMVLAEGWGLIMDNINPGLVKRTKLVYKIPADVKGGVTYHPARSGDKDVIFLGNL